MRVVVPMRSTEPVNTGAFPVSAKFWVSSGESI